MLPRIESLESRQLFTVHGLNATYFNDVTFTGGATERIDPGVNFDFGDHARPAPGIKGNTFAVRWDGLVQPTHSETYTFSTRNNDGVRLWINGQLIIDSWQASARKTHSGSIALKKNHVYDLRLEYFDGIRTAAISLSWSSPSTPAAIVPTKHLFAYDTRFAAIGDFGYESHHEQGMAVMVQGWAPDYIITVGDNNYPKGESSTIDRNVGQYFHNFISPYKGSFGAGAKTNLFFPVPGNHDWDSPDLKGYHDYFTLPGNERYYDFVRGPIHFFGIDSDPHEPDGTSASSKQGQWLKAALAASTSPFNIVYFHHPAYSSGEKGSTGHMQWPFREWGADVVLNGHDHDYERLFENGIPYIVDGAGSADRSFKTPIAGSIVRNNTDSGALLIQANSDFITFQYELRDGTVIDTFTTDAHAADLK